MATKTKDKKEYWLFAIYLYNTYTNIFCDHFPTKEELTSMCKSKRYKITFMTKLTEEQYNNLKPEEEV